MKNKWLAAMLNILPGAGYLYLGVRTPFAVILLLMLPAVFIAGTADPSIANSSDSGSSFSWGVIIILLTPMIAFMVDAFNEAGRVNDLKHTKLSQLVEKTKLVETKTLHEVHKLVKSDEAELFVVGTAKFVVLSVLTFSLYQVYWAYKNWKAIRAQENSNISPFWRAVFSILFLYSLLGKIQAILRTHEKKIDLSVLDRTVLWVGFSLATRIWAPLIVLDAIKPFILMGVQQKVNSVYANNRKISNRLSVPEWTITIAGVSIAALALVGVFVFHQG